MKLAPIILIVLVCGCETQTTNHDIMSPPPPTPPRAKQAPPVAPTVAAPKVATPTASKILLGQSVKKKPIEMHRFGAAGPSVLILAGIHGNETSTVTLGRNLVTLLQSNPQAYAGRQVAVIPVANPDGFAAKTRTNANGVDCNRNFPASNYKSRSRYGAEPTSEPETRAVMRAMEITRPRLIISIHSIDTGRECNNYDGPAERFANLMHRLNGYPVTKTMGYPTPGSLGSWAGIDQKIPIITLELPRTQSGEAAWQKNRDALLAAIAATE